MADLGKTIRRLRQRLELTMAELGGKLGVTHASVSRYESGQTVPSPSVLMHLLKLAETDEERSVLSSAIENGQEEDSELNVIREIRKASGMDRKLFAVKVGASISDVDEWEAGRNVPEPSIITKLKSIAAECGRGDLAMTLSSDDWTIKAVFHPGEKFISQRGKESASDLARRERLHRLVEEILATGNDPLISHAEMSLNMVKNQAEPAKADSRKKAG